jgi:hypothetical protein
MYPEKKVKIKLSPCLTKYHAMKHGGTEVLLVFLTSAVDGDEWSASRPVYFTSEKEPQVSTGKETGWAPPEPVWTRWRREKFPSFPLPGIELRSSCQ